MRLLSVLAVAALLLGVLAGAALAQPATGVSLSESAASPAKALIAPLAQETTPTVGVEVEVQPAPQAAQPTTTTNNFFVSIPWWGWLLVVLLIVALIAFIAGANRGGGGGNTTVIKD